MHGGGGHGGGGHGHGGGHASHDGGFSGTGSATGREMILAAKLTHCDEHRIISERSFDALYLLGLGLLSVGLLFGIGVPLLIWRNLQEGQSAVIGLPFLGVGLWFAFMGVLVMSPSWLEIDVAARAYRVYYGWRPLGIKRSGGLEDFIRLSAPFTSYYGGKTAIQLYWRDPKRRPYTLHTSGKEEARRYRQAVARLLGFADVDKKNKDFS